MKNAKILDFELQVHILEFEKIYAKIEELKKQLKPHSDFFKAIIMDAEPASDNTKANFEALTGLTYSYTKPYTRLNTGRLGKEHPDILKSLQEEYGIAVAGSLKVKTKK